MEETIFLKQTQFCSLLKWRDFDFCFVRQERKRCEFSDDSPQETAKDIILSVQEQEEELLKELRDKRDVKLKRLMKELDSVNFHVAKACSLQVSVSPEKLAGCVWSSEQPWWFPPVRDCSFGLS